MPMVKCDGAEVPCCLRPGQLAIIGENKFNTNNEYHVVCKLKHNKVIMDHRMEIFFLLGVALYYIVVQ